MPRPLPARSAKSRLALAGVATFEPVRFSTDPAECARFWNVRKGMFPSVGAMRKVGTTVIIEDVAFPVPRLAAATLDLQRLLAAHGYPDAIIFGHALAGNLHFVFTQDFNSPPEVERYRRFMDELCRMVVERYDGSLKAEHGTGRNIAPFVELEWGSEAYALMRRIKQMFDPRGLLNPGVLINDDPEAHVRNLKPLAASRSRWSTPASSAAFASPSVRRAVSRCRRASASPAGARSRARSAAARTSLR